LQTTSKTMWTIGRTINFMTRETGDAKRLNQVDTVKSGRYVETGHCPVSTKS